MTPLEKIIEYLDAKTTDRIVLYEILQDKSHNLNIHVPKTDKLVFNRHVLPLLKKEEKEDCFVLNPLDFGEIKYIKIDISTGVYFIDLYEEFSDIRIRQLLNSIYHKDMLKCEAEIIASIVFEGIYNISNKEEFFALDDTKVFINHKLFSAYESVVNGNDIHITTTIDSKTNNVKLQSNITTNTKYEDFYLEVLFSIPLGKIMIEDIGRII